ncbi:MAG: RND transporter, partial [Actinomycetales bacterium]
MTGSTRRTVAALLLVGSVVTFVVVGLSKADVRTDLDSFLPQQDPVAQRYARLTESFGADPVVVMLQARSGASLLGEKPLQSVVRLEGRLAQLKNVSGVYGPGTLLNQIAGRAQDLLTELLGRRDAIVARAKADAEQKGRSPAAAGKKARAA